VYIKNKRTEVVVKKIFHPISNAVYALFTKLIVKVMRILSSRLERAPKGPSAFLKRTVRRNTGKRISCSWGW